jgi:acetaldehyde dehydrogenase
VRQAAILGPGNIGTDLLVKLSRSKVIEPVCMVGVVPGSDGLARAEAMGIASSSEGLPWLLDQPPPDVVFDCTSASSHRAHAELLEARGLRVIDLTPAALGPFVCPPVNLDDERDCANLNLISCGGQATIPMVHAVHRVTEVAYAEVVCSISSLSAGPGTRANIDSFTATTAAGLEQVGGARLGKAIIVLNPADPPMNMRNTVYCAVARGCDRSAIVDSIESMVAEVQAYVPGYTLTAVPQFDTVETPAGKTDRVSVFLEVVGAGDHFPSYAGNLDIMTAAAVRVAESWLA